MSTQGARGEMPFLDHLEELRWRILWSLLAIVAGSVVGFFLVQHFDVLGLLKRPITPFLPGDKLFITRPTDAFMITLKLAIFVGVVFAAPVVIYQVWKFLSPALYTDERRFAIPALFAGTLLFLAGVLLAYLWVLPAALRILFSFQRADLEPIITAGEYFTFAAQVIFAFGIMFELPLVIVLLSATGIVNPAFFQKNRPLALVIAAIIAAFLTPPDALSMMMMLGPLIVLYETGIAIARVVWRRRRSRSIGTAAVILLACLGGAEPAAAQGGRGPPDSARVIRDSLLRPARDSLAAGQALDTATARQLGLPTQPSRGFPAPDSALQALLRREGFRVIRFAGDSMVLHADTQAIELMGQALVRQDGATLESDTVFLHQRACLLRASGGPTLFQEGTVLVGEQMRYDTCARRGFVEGALTAFQEAGVEWFMRGGLSIDSASVRMYAKGSAITSCELPEPHYHFAAGEVKWVTDTYMVARPVVLYVRDIPILWLPFIFQDTRPGRRSGILVPRFGINDIWRLNPGYRRHITNVGYYFAISDYLDAQFSVDWFAGNYMAANGEVRYRWLNRFVRGGVSLTQRWESQGAGGGRSLHLRWGHQQQFDYRTSFNASVDYATSAQVVERNAVDPDLATANLGSSLTFSKQWDWATLSLGATRRQELTSGTVTQTLPSLSLTPVPIDMAGGALTWRPSIAITNDRTFDAISARGIVEASVLPGDTLMPRDTMPFDSRRTAINVQTPLRVGRWNWANSFRFTDFIAQERDVQFGVDSAGDSTQTVFALNFASELDWTTGINLPLVFPSSWKLQPTVGIQNTTGGAFMVRNRATRGEWVSQGKRLSFSAGVRPALFAFFPGIGPVSRIRHSISPFVDWSWAPAATIPEEYLRATGGQTSRSPAQQRITFGLSQTFEGKLELPAGDTASDPRNVPKIKLLQIQTSSLTYDFEQAKEDGRTGWQTPDLSNQFTSDLVPGFTLATTHSLWRGQVGTDTAAFDPFLTRVSARFTITQRTIGGILGLITGRAPAAPGPGEEAVDSLPPTPVIPGDRGGRFRDQDLDRPVGPGAAGRFSASISYDETRQRPLAGAPPAAQPDAARDLGLNLSFAPARNWSVAWNTRYNLTTKEFGSHALRLERDLHRWRATFQFLQAPNGNFAFNFFISLLDQPDIRFQYDQQTVR